MRHYFTLFCLLSLACATTQAQVYNTGILYIGNGSTLYSLGDFTNITGANYKNDGSVYITGNISNDQSSLPAGGGTTYFNGATAQTLGGSAPFRSFNVTLDNTAGLTLTNRLAIGDGTGGTLIFTAGQIRAGGTAQDVYFYSGSGYAGYDAGHHIIGYTTKSGSTDFTFPIGDGVNKADLDLSSLSASSDFQVRYIGTGYGTYNASAPLIPGGVFEKEWWDIHRTAGTATAKVSLKWNDARQSFNHSAPATLVIAHFTGGSWQSEGGTSGDAAGSSTGTVGPGNSISTFSPFTFGSTTTPLPILLNYFTGTEKNCQAYLEWSTALEQNANGFEIQQSADGIGYSTVDFVKAKGVPSNYAISVPQTLQQAFYRIREEDLDGQFTYSSIVGVSVKPDCIANGEILAVYPNPVLPGGNTDVRFVVPVAKGAAQLQIYDMAGKMIYSRIVQVNSGLNLYTIPSVSLARGIYTLFVIGDGWKTAGVKILKGE